VVSASGTIERQAGTEMASYDGGTVTAGERVEVRYADDAMDDAGGDRNLVIEGVSVEP
jgi:hypothetical protein